MQIRSGYMDLGKVADGLSQAYLTFKLNHTTAKDLSMPRNCRHLQRLELSKNELSELRHLSGMENLVYLNVSGTDPPTVDSHSLSTYCTLVHADG